jgi:hypothetical protein
MSANRRIFASATNRDLRTYRELATKSLRKRGYDVDDEAVFNLSFLQLSEMLKQRIEKCDADVSELTQNSSRIGSPCSTMVRGRPVPSVYVASSGTPMCR